MRFLKRDYSANRTLLTCFLLALVPMGAGANAGSSPTGAAMPAPLIAQLAEDENVEDVVQSEPRKIAPNVDLKKVAPMPEPEPESESELAGPEPVPSETFTLLGKEVLPGTSTRLAWSPNIQIAGLSQTTPVLVVNGAHTGPTLCLTGGDSR